MKKFKQLYILLTLTKCHSTIASFDLWMSKSGHDNFVLVINFLRANWQPKSITFDFYEATNINGQTLPIKLTKIVGHL
jgi:hypothetical protein